MRFQKSLRIDKRRMRMITEVSERGQPSVTGVRAPAYDACQLRGAGRTQWLDEFWYRISRTSAGNRIRDVNCSIPTALRAPQFLGPRPSSCNPIGT